MKIALIINAIQCGGADRVIVSMANYWSAKGLNVTLITFDHERAEPFYPLDPKIIYHPMNLKNESKSIFDKLYGNLKRIYKIRQSLQQIQPDVVISFIDITNIIVLFATMRMRFPVIVSERIDPQYHFIGRWDKIRMLLYPYASALVCQTYRAKAYFPKGIQEKTVIIPNPVIFPSKAEDFQPSFQKPFIMALGRLHPQKGHDILLRAFALVNKAHPDWKLIIVGEGPFRQELENLIIELQIEKSVFLPGKVLNVYAILKQADIFVHPSRFEGFPNALCEAMACGLPVIATDCPSGPAEIIQNHVNGILVPNQCVKGLAEAMKFLILNKSERERLSTKALLILDQFSQDKIMEQWEDLISTVCET